MRRRYFRPNPGIEQVMGVEFLNESYPAVAESVPRARNELREFAALAGVGPDQMDAICLSASEALTNVVVHAYEGAPGMIHVTAALAAGEMWVLIADDGRGMQARGDTPGLGMGLALIASSSDDLVVLRRASGGTELRMRFGVSDAGTPAMDQLRGSFASAVAPASSRFCTTT
jgi:serine/threonine-protein kinase RsbW